MSFIVDRTKQIRDGAEVCASDQTAIKNALELINEIIETIQEKTDITSKPKFYKQLGKYIDAVILKTVYDSWDLPTNTVDVDSVKVTLEAYQQRLMELESAINSQK